jgi:hypothetical protein
MAIFRFLLFLLFVPTCLMAQLNGDGWFFYLGSTQEELVVPFPQESKSGTLVRLPHRILEPNRSLWYQQRVKLSIPAYLDLNADDGAQVFYNKKQISTLDGRYFWLEPTADSVDLIVRVLNNAMAGGLRRADLVTSLPMATSTCASYPGIPWLQMGTDGRYVVKIYHPNTTTLWLGYQYDGQEIQEIPGHAQAGIITFEIPLHAGQDWSYTILGQEEGGGIWYQVKVPPPVNPLRFGIWADSQGGWNTFRMLTTGMARQAINFSVGIGDLTAAGQDSCQWLALLEALGESAATTPTFFVPGNHDYDGYYDDLVPVNYQRFISNHNYFSWERDDCYFLALDPNETFPLAIRGQQARWFKQQIRSRAWKQARWRFIFVHQPPYSQGWEGYTGDRFIRQLVDRYAARYHIDFVISGHSHCYERLSKHYGRQTTHFLIVGGAGGGLEAPENSPAPQMDKVIKAHHYGVVEVTEKQVTISIFGTDGSLLDRFMVPNKQ